MNLEDLRTELRAHVNPEKAEFLPYFFKTGPGQYGEGDKFLGVVMPDSRKIVKKYALRVNDLQEILPLLHSEWHEERMVALLILVEKYKKQPELRDKIYDLYLKNTKYINNWDLVDLSAPDIVGRHLFEHRELLRNFIKFYPDSPLLWDRRIAVLASFYFIKNGEFEPTLTIVEKLLTDKEDLMHKACGWMLREIYKRIDEAVVENFIKLHYHQMPRTMLRYAIERMPEGKRKRFLIGKF